MKKRIHEQNYSIVKHNDLIEARYKLTLHEQKLVLTVAMMIRPNDKNFHEYQLTVKYFMDLMGVDGHDYHIKIRQCSKSLLKKPLVIPLEGGNELICNWFSSIKYLKGEGRIIFCFDPALKPYLLQLQRKFTEYKTQNIMKLNSGFAIRLYELLKQYSPIGERVIDLDKFRLMLGIDGKYKTYTHIKQRILEPSKIELTEKTDIAFSYKPIKTIRKVTAIHFSITKTVDTDSVFQAKNPKINEFINSIEPFGISPKDAEQAIERHGLTGAITIRDYALAQIKAAQNGDGKPIRKPGAYLAKCLKEGYGKTGDLPKIKTMTDQAVKCWQQFKGNCPGFRGPTNDTSPVCEYCPGKVKR